MVINDPITHQQQISRLRNYEPVPTVTSHIRSVVGKIFGDFVLDMSRSIDVLFTNPTSHTNLYKSLIFQYHFFRWLSPCKQPELQYVNITELQFSVLFIGPLYNNTQNYLLCLVWVNDWKVQVYAWQLVTKNLSEWDCETG
jgi:hypothetical protein